MCEQKIGVGEHRLAHLELEFDNQNTRTNSNGQGWSIDFPNFAKQI